MKNAIASILIAIAATVIGGIIVFHYGYLFSAEPPLTYSVDSKATFSMIDSQLISYAGQIRNNTRGKINGVTIDLKVAQNISEFKVAIPQRAPDDLTIKGENGTRTVFIPYLRGGEGIDFQVLARVPALSRATFSVNSNEIVGEMTERISSSLTSALGPIAVALAGLVSGLSTFFLRNRKDSLAPRVSANLTSFNNSAFVLMHLGYSDEAARLLESSIEKTGGNASVLANLGACYALNGDPSRGHKYVSAAKFLMGNEDADFIILTESILLFASNDNSGARAALGKFKEKFPKVFAAYSKYSSLIKQIETSTPGSTGN